MLTKHSFYKFLHEITESKAFCIAFSGGLDSTVLLHLFSKLREWDPSIAVRAIHVNHSLSVNADSWAKICTQVANDLNIPLIVQKLNLQKRTSESLEELARVKRYETFKNVLQDDEVLVTAHHQNDQAETLLLQLFRGAGPKGLASMPQMSRFGNGFLMRPLLEFTRDSLEEYASSEQLQWLEDESNLNTDYDRNFLRHSLLPLIQKRWPNIHENLARTAKHCANASNFIDIQIEAAFKEVFDKQQNTLVLSKLLSFDLETQNYLIRYWLQQLNMPLPSTLKLQLLQKEIVHSREDAMPLLCWKNVEVRRYANHLYAMSPLPKHDANLHIQWDMLSDLVLPNNLGIITLNELEKTGLNLSELAEVTIRFRQGGERCRLKNRKNTHSLKKLFQSWRIPPWNRDRVPLLFSRDQLKAVIGYAVCEQID